MSEHLSTWTPVERHPCTFSREVLDVARSIIPRGARVHDCCAGPMNKLGRLANEMGWDLTGIELEHPWPPDPKTGELPDHRVKQGDMRDPTTYPEDPDSWLFTSVTYGNRNGSDYNRGPTPRTKLKGRRSYTLALGHLLHPDNTARYRADDPRYWKPHTAAAKLWPNKVLLNCDLPISERWQELLEGQGYTILEVIPVFTPRHGGLSNAELRPEHEVVIVATRSPQ